MPIIIQDPSGKYKAVRKGDTVYYYGPDGRLVDVKIIKTPVQKLKEKARDAALEATRKVEQATEAAGQKFENAAARVITVPSETLNKLRQTFTEHRAKSLLKEVDPNFSWDKYPGMDRLIIRDEKGRTFILRRPGAADPIDIYRKSLKMRRIREEVAREMAEKLRNRTLKDIEASIGPVQKAMRMQAAQKVLKEIQQQENKELRGLLREARTSFRGKRSLTSPSTVERARKKLNKPTAEDTRLTIRGIESPKAKLYLPPPRIKSPKAKPHLPPPGPPLSIWEKIRRYLQAHRSQAIGAGAGAALGGGISAALARRNRLLASLLGATAGGVAGWHLTPLAQELIRRHSKKPTSKE